MTALTCATKHTRKFPYGTALAVDDDDRREQKRRDGIYVDAEEKCGPGNRSGLRKENRAQSYGQRSQVQIIATSGTRSCQRKTVTSIVMHMENTMKKYSSGRSGGDRSSGDRGPNSKGSRYFCNSKMAENAPGTARMGACLQVPG